MNRRNAVVGWITLKVGKALARRQVKRAVRSKLASWWSDGRRSRSAAQRTA